MSALGAGALTGAVYMAARKSTDGFGKIIAVFTCFMGVAIVLTSFSEHMALSLIFLCLGDLCMIMSLAAINTFLQTIVDEDKRGRVMSFYAMALMGTQPIGNLLAGTVASGIGIPHTLLIGGIITVLSGIWFGFSCKVW